MRNRWVTHSNAAAFQAVADPTRRAVLDLLRRGSLPAGAIARAFPVSRPAISRHLRVLRRARLVEERRSGRHRIYRLNADPLKGVDRWLEAYREFWNSKLGDLKNFLEGEASKADAGRQGRKRRADSRARRKVK
ncbi:MAG TPA: metalloregulator ArsR/SmtB family transcription factor [Methylomirabilota bacterium]|nr:metalloregulator ArsR/SmtB family transcription factor [Methylomirabilota bacterium]